MKTLLTLALMTLAASGLYADSTRWPLPYQDQVIRTKTQAENCCKPEAKVALACKDCKTSTEKSGTEKKGIMAWFKPDSMHDCDGCKGKITVKQFAAGKVNDVQYSHVCSKCGPKSAFTCSTHAK